MPPKKNGLGRGLSEIFMQNESEDHNDTITLKISEIEPNKNQPRREFEPESLNELLRLRGERGLEINSIRDAYLEYARENNIDNVADYLGESTENLNNDLHDAVGYFNDGNYDEFAAFTTRKLLERIDDLHGRLDDENEFVDIKVRDVLKDIENLKNELR